MATSAFQIEGAAREGGKAESIWDRFCRQPGAILDGSDGDVACDHYHRWEEDVALVASLGVQCYRFSVAWPRVLPKGRGAWNERGLAFYDRLVDGLLAAGIEPCLTLNHWDLPQALQEEGGWAARDTVHCFVEYALGVNRRLGDRVKLVTTHNEPWVIAHFGHETGTFAPGLKSRKTAMQVAHHLLLSHSQALKALRADGTKALLGIVLNLAHHEPASPSSEDVARMEVDKAFRRCWYTEALFNGRYPQIALDELGADAPVIAHGDMACIAQPLDYLGVNYYSRAVSQASGPFDVKSSGLPLTAMGWEVYPRGLTELLTTLHREYKLPPVYITENGMACEDRLEAGRVRDPLRMQYLSEHIGAVADAMDLGVPVAGYMVWSLLDNFEWSSGYARRFGIVHVDYDTLRRTPKDSARWYADFVKRQRARRWAD